MRLKKLELYGFKSFADKTEITFESGITCIVGPNGTGKSNIVDSIRWVLGEQSAKSLRSSLMENCIFNGTEFRKPLGMAEVSLTFSEVKGQLSLDFEEVTISRQIFRSAECEYFINKSPCRLKDITELFLDTGIGTDSYFIMEQGKMDVILDSKPIERRSLFEEAAGISKYKLRKEEALKKLELTEQNLMRVRDIIAEIKRQISSLERHAKKARKYKELAEELKQIEISLKSSKYCTSKEELKKLTTRENLLKKEVKELQDKINNEELRLQEERKNLLEEEKKLTLKQEEFYKIANEINNVFNKINLLAERKESLRESIEDINLRIEAQNNKITAIRNQIEELKTEHNETVESLSSERDKVKKQTEDSKSAKEKSKTNEKTLEELRIQYFDAVNEVAHLKNEIKNLDNREKEYKYRIERITKRKEEYFSCKAFSENKLLEIKNVLSSIGESSKFMSSESVYEYTAEEIKNVHNIETDINSKLNDILKEENTNVIKTIVNNVREKWGLYVKKVKSLFLILQDVEGTIAKKHEEVSLINETNRINKEINLINDELKQIQIEMNDTKIQREESSRKFEDLQNKQKDKEEKIKTLELEINTARQIEEIESEKFTDVKVKLTFLEQKEINLKDEINRLTLNIEEIEVNNKLSKKELEEKNAQITANDAEIETLNKFLKETTSKKDDFENIVADERKNNEIIRETFYKDEENLMQYRKEYEIKQKSLYEVDLGINNLNLKMNNCREQILRDYRLDLETLKIEKDYLKENNLDEAAALSRIEELRNTLSEMGAVNLVAMDEYEELQNRYTYLASQENDLSQSKQLLIKTINGINQTTKELFSETFKKIKSNFNEVFRKLFNGGYADLVLLDESNLLETGIEVIARPPGKRPQNVTMLSGGEKALTAIALLFAVFMVKPSPFCILDEIDAPLDDANVIRFRDMLKSMFSHVQFIIITHNKLTMESTDVLYGVTQAEAGVSQIISVKLKELSSASQVNKENQSATG